MRLFSHQSHYCDWMQWRRHPVSTICNIATAVTHRPIELSTYCTQCVPGTIDLGGNQHGTRDDHSARCCTIEIRSATSLMSSWPDDIIQIIHCTPTIFGRNTTLSPKFAYLIKHVTNGIITNYAHSHSLLQKLRIQIRPYNVQIPVLTSKQIHCFSTSTNNQEVSIIPEIFTTFKHLFT
jgi:hypothetical protein